MESLRRISLLCGLAFLLAGCEGDPVGLVKPESYQVVEGACGEILFVESLGSDLASALEVLEERKIDQFGDVTLETYPIEVIDQNGSAPQKEFYAVRILEGDTQSLAHSVVEVVTTQGDLFHLEWCPD